MLALVCVLGAAPPDPSPDPTPSDAPTESAESAPARTTEENARLRARASELLASALPDGKPFRGVLRHRVWGVGPAPEKMQPSEATWATEYILTYVNARNWSLIERGTMRGQMQQGDVAYHVSPPPGAVMASFRAGGPVCELLDLAVQSTSFGISFGWGADQIATLKNEVDILKFEESQDSILIEFDNPVARKLDLDSLVAEGRLTTEQIRQVEARKFVVGMVIGRGEFPRLSRTSFSFINEAGVRTEWVHGEVQEWKRWNDRWFGRKVVRVIGTTPGQGQRSELTVESIEPLDADDATLAALPEGTRVRDHKLDFEFTIGSTVIKLRDEEIVLSEPLHGHPGDRLPELVQAATLRNREGDAAPTATKPAVVP